MNRILALCSQTPRYFAGRLALLPGEYCLGRSSKCDLVVKDKSISRRHAALKAGYGGLFVTDLDSRNGIFVDCERIDRGQVKPGQQVRFGRVAFLVMELSVPKNERIDSEVATSTCSESSNSDG